MDIITEFEYDFVAPNDFDYPQYILAKTEAFTLDKISLKEMLSGKIEKLNACFKFSSVFFLIHSHPVKLATPKAELTIIFVMLCGMFILFICFSNVMLVFVI